MKLVDVLGDYGPRLFANTVVDDVAALESLVSMGRLLKIDAAVVAHAAVGRDFLLERGVANCDELADGDRVLLRLMRPAMPLPAHRIGPLRL